LVLKDSTEDVNNCVLYYDKHIKKTCFQDKCVEAKKMRNLGNSLFSMSVFSNSTAHIID